MLHSMGLKEKRIKSNQARLKSLKLLQQNVQRSKMLIKSSLNNLDTPKKQHIKFDDSDNELSCNSSGSEITNAQTFNITDSLGIEDDSEEITLDASLKKNFSEKMMRMQNRIGFDERFKIDERFVDSNDEDDNGERETHSEGNVADEIKRNLAVLQQVVGTTTSIKKEKRKSVHFYDPSSKRYDPSQQDHAQLEVAPKKNKTIKNKMKIREVVPEVSKTQYYELSSSNLKQAFGKPTDRPTENSQDNQNGCNVDNKPFSLLNMLGRDQEIAHESSEDEKVPEYEILKKQKKDKLKSSVIKSHLFKHDSSDSELSDEEMQTGLKSSQDVVDLKRSSVTLPPAKSRRYFLFFQNDAHFFEGPKKFCSNKSPETIRQEWLEVKDQLRTEYKKKHKQAFHFQRKTTHIDG